MAQEPLEKTQQSCPLVGEGAKSCLQQDVRLLQRKVMTAGMREGEKNSGQYPVWEKIAPLPAPASLHLEPAKRVTASSQPTVWQRLTPHTLVSLGDFHLSIFCAGSRDKTQFFPGRGGQRTQKEVGKAMAASACYHCLWARAEHLREPHEWDATAPPWFNIATSTERVSRLL